MHEGMTFHEEQEEAVASLARTALLSDNLQTLLDETVLRVADTLDVELCQILELLPNGKLSLKAGLGWSSGLVGRASLPSGLDSQAGYTLAQNSPVVVRDLKAESRFADRSWLSEHGAVSGLTVVILGANHRPFGVLGAHTRNPREFGRPHVKFAQTVSHVIAAAIQRHRHEERLFRYARIVESSHDAIIGKRLDGTITEWNQGASRVYGYSAEEMLGRSIGTLIPPERADELPMIYERLARGDHIEPFETVRLTRRGERIPVLVTVSPVRDPSGRIVEASSIARDLSHAKDTERRLKDLTESLEHRVRERTQELVDSQNDLRRMASELTLAELRERRRIATELHDYLAQLLVVGRLKVGQLTAAIATQQGKAMLQELDQILDRSLTYTRTLVAELSPTVLYELGLPAALQWLGNQMQRNGLTVEVRIEEVDAPIPENEAVLIYQTVRELLLNVIKHAAVKQALVRFGKTAQGELEVAVVDEGKGFDVSSLRSRQTVPTKFGLFSIRERLHALGGRFDIVSFPGKGTTAVLRVPLRADTVVPKGSLQAAPASSPSPSRRRRSDKSRIRVALVDDHAMVRQGLRSILDDADDLEVVGEAEDGQAAIEVARRARPDVIVLDINLPKLNGIEVTRRILAEHPTTTIIGISVNDDDQVARAVKAAGATAFLPKGSAASHLMREIYSSRNRRRRESNASGA